MSNEEKKTVSGFIKTGLLVLGSLLILYFGIKIVPQAISTSTFINEKKLPIYCVNTEEKKVALSFDAAWGNEDTQAILDILKKHNVHVTFFMTGGWIPHCTYRTMPKPQCLCGF